MGSGAMFGRQCNVFNSSPSGICQYLWLAMSYFPVLIAMSIMFCISYPFFAHFCAGVAPKHGFGIWIPAGGVLFVGLMFVSFLRAVFTHPGYVDRAVWKHAPRVDDEPQRTPNPHFVEQTLHSGAPRFCHECQIYRPDHAHHCSDCNACVYRMDHHCPWINNCVGLHNTKYFLLFVSYVGVAGFWIVGTVGYVYYSANIVLLNGSGTWSHILVMMSTVGAFVVASVLSFFALFNWCMLAQGDSSFSRKRKQKQLEAASPSDTNKKQRWSLSWCCIYMIGAHTWTWEAYRDVFGFGPSWTVFLPMTPQHHPNFYRAVGPSCDEDVV